MKAENKKINKIPVFKNEDEEREFWAKHSFLDFPDRFKEVKLDLSNLKPSTRPITVRLPLFLIEDLKLLANKKDVPYQSLMKVLLAEKVREEFHPKYQ
ncbi:MAG: BrnA antitoxin family protein [Candidatus Woesebacteria bacterium]|nr:BrnA antitoxin family protein [Candidatus Woesebacteria bacterium]